MGCCCMQVDIVFVSGIDNASDFVGEKQRMSVDADNHCVICSMCMRERMCECFA